MAVDLQIGEIRRHPVRGKVQLVSFSLPQGNARFLDMNKGEEMPCALAFWVDLPLWPDENPAAHITESERAWGWKA